MIKPCPCGHPGCKSWIAPPLVNCACNSLTKDQALLIDSAIDLRMNCEALLEIIEQQANRLRSVHTGVIDNLGTTDASETLAAQIIEKVRLNVRKAKGETR